jgi:hypothetical protein
VVGQGYRGKGKRMNERIKELMKEANQGITLGKPFWPALEEFSEKFTKLIVTECVDICNQAILQNQDTLSKLNEDELAEKMIIHGSINQAQKLGKGIKQHFGVEE